MPGRGSYPGISRKVVASTTHTHTHGTTNTQPTAHRSRSFFSSSLYENLHTSTITYNELRTLYHKSIRVSVNRQRQDHHVEITCDSVSSVRTDGVCRESDESQRGGQSVSRRVCCQRGYHRVGTFYIFDALFLNRLRHILPHTMRVSNLFIFFPTHNLAFVGIWAHLSRDQGRERRIPRTVYTLLLPLRRTPQLQYARRG